jgi:hypothetical protein
VQNSHGQSVAETSEEGAARRGANVTDPRDPNSVANLRDIGTKPPTRTMEVAENGRPAGVQWPSRSA